MPTLRSLFLTIALSSLALASPTPASLLNDGTAASIDSSKVLADEIAWFDLGDYEHGNSTDVLEKRLNVDYCVANAAQTSNCIALGGLVTAVAAAIASNIKSDSNANDCSEHTGSLDNVNWAVYATGRNCDTTAQLDTIQGAMTKYLKAQGDQVCNVKCIKMDHGGTWTGYVTIAPSGTNLDNYYCGSAYSFGSCGSGGNGDT